MLEQLDLTKVLILDIETIPQYASFEELPDRWKELWIKKAGTINKDATLDASAIYPRAFMLSLVK